SGVELLTKDQIAKIFEKGFTNWEQLGGHDQAIVLFNRPLGSGTRKVFSTFFLSGREPENGAAVLETSDQVAQKVKNTPGALSYVALSYASKFNVPVVAIGGVTPSLANIGNKSYGFWTYEHMYTSSKSSPAAESFIDYVKSDDGAIDRLGFIAIKDVAKSGATGASPQ
ncbi:MAG: substrate-binding domain-containing protein, partial [Candidatus Eremiobacteraeota bacterium]|nr:substrate-binding domain-containing protein [Candidatus Eremiobacteraeota bacterium]